MPCMSRNDPVYSSLREVRPESNWTTEDTLLHVVVRTTAGLCTPHSTKLPTEFPPLQVPIVSPANNSLLISWHTKPGLRGRSRQTQDWSFSEIFLCLMRKGLEEKRRDRWFRLRSSPFSRQMSLSYL